MQYAGLLADILGDDFIKSPSPENMLERFFAKPLSWAQLEKLHNFVRSSDSGGIPSGVRIKSTAPEGEKPFVILAMLHGNEPAGLAGILLAMALAECGQLTRDVIGVIGNPLASSQYFDAYMKNPSAPQYSRDCYRCGVADDGSLLPDMNRIPVDFLSRTDGTAHTLRARELYALAQNIWGITDIHSARGPMVCFTDFKHACDLRYSPIRSVLVGLSEAIGVHASKQVKVQTFKTILAPMEHIKSHTGIEAGSHEDENAPMLAAAFTHALLYNLGITPVKPEITDDAGRFERYTVCPRITYADLVADAPLPGGDMVYMAREENGKITHSQYQEMEAIKKHQVVAVAEPSGILLQAPHDFSGIFFSKSGKLFDKDPAVGPWPLPASALSSTKFCYPCDVDTWHIDWENEA